MKYKKGSATKKQRDLFDKAMENVRGGFNAVGNMNIDEVISIIFTEEMEKEGGDNPPVVLLADKGFYDSTLSGIANMSVLLKDDDKAIKEIIKLESTRLIRKHGVVSMKQYGRSLDDGSILDKEFKCVAMVPLANNYAAKDAPKVRYQSYNYEGYAEYLTAISESDDDDASRRETFRKAIPKLLKSKLEGTPGDEEVMKVPVLVPVA